MPLFKINGNKAEKLYYKDFSTEREIQNLIENNMIEMLGITFLQSEYSFPDGRMDSIAIDSAGNPTIIEYKLGQNDNVLSQGLFYMDWLEGHRGDFEILVRKKLNSDIDISWNHVRLIIIARSFSKYDVHAVNAIGRDIDLVKYTSYTDSMLYFEKININHTSGASSAFNSSPAQVNYKSNEQKSLSVLQAKTAPEVIEVFNELRSRLIALDETITENVTSVYLGFSSTRNFLEIWFKAKSLQCMILQPENDPKGLAVKVPDTYRWTLNYRVNITTLEDLDNTFDLIKQSFNKVQ